MHELKPLKQHTDGSQVHSHYAGQDSSHKVIRVIPGGWLLKRVELRLWPGELWIVVMVEPALAAAVAHEFFGRVEQ